MWVIQEHQAREDLLDFLVVMAEMEHLGPLVILAER